MITKIELSNFKCFQLLKLPITELTLLAGSNASGKSSLLQALVILHQTIRENEWSTRLILNGSILSLGTVQDVVNKVHGRNAFELSLTNENSRYSWTFSGERPEMSMAVKYVTGSPSESEDESVLNKLIPFAAGATPKICKTIEC
ncbi:AAA family ATPase, partial [Pseudomonas amygdali]|uniref:AAA family ATPase n=1 Tax=Pseudomonas amygdali TaxID=47877 RepID=UPI0016745890